MLDHIALETAFYRWRRGVQLEWKLTGMYVLNKDDPWQSTVDASNAAVYLRAIWEENARATYTVVRDNARVLVQLKRTKTKRDAGTGQPATYYVQSSNFVDYIMRVVPRTPLP